MHSATIFFWSGAVTFFTAVLIPLFHGVMPLRDAEILARTSADTTRCSFGTRSQCALLAADALADRTSGGVFSACFFAAAADLARASGVPATTFTALDKFLQCVSVLFSAATFADNDCFFLVAVVCRLPSNRLFPSSFLDINALVSSDRTAPDAPSPPSVQFASTNPSRLNCAIICTSSANACSSESHGNTKISIPYLATIALWCLLR